MDHPARLPIDCPRCENRGVLALNDDRTVVRYGYGEAANWQALEDAARQIISGYGYAPYRSELSPFPAELAAQIVR
jgi:hypothetical protein